MSFSGIQESNLFTKHSKWSINPERKNIQNYKFVEPHMAVFRGLGARLDMGHNDDFKETYGNVLGIMNTEVNITNVHTLVQFYDPLLRYFTFQDYQLVPTLEEYSHILVLGSRTKFPTFTLRKFLNIKPLLKLYT